MGVTAVNIPPVGEKFHERGLRTVKNTLNGSDADTAGTFTLFEVDPGVFILEVRTQIETALPSGVTMTIGDSDDVDGWLTAATIADTVAVATGLFKSSMSADSDNLYGIARGKYITDTSAQTIDAVITGALAAAGKVNVVVLFAEF
jgi:hypothetical protein